MKKSSIIKMFSILTMATAGALALGSAINNNKKVDAVEATSVPTDGSLYRFTVPSRMSSIFLHAWNGGTSYTTWGKGGFIELTNYSYNENDEKVFTFIDSRTFTGFIIIGNEDNPDSWKSGDINVGSNKAWSWSGDTGATPSAWTPTSVTYRFYDYDGSFDNNPVCLAKQSNGDLNNGSGVPLTKITNTSRVYSVDLDPSFDQFKVQSGETATDYIWINKNRLHTYFHNHPTVEWSDNLSWAEAHDWVYQTMHLRDISTSNNADTGACLGNNGYYKIAKDAYSALGSAVQSQMQYIDDFGNAKARLSAWAAANGETASWSGSTLSISSARTFLMPTANVEKTNTIAIIVIISLVSVTAIGGYFFIKRRQEN